MKTQQHPAATIQTHSKKDSDRTGEVLVVDDNPDNVRVVSEILYKAGAEVSFALSGEAALTHLRRRHPDVILLDVSMPGMNGYELCSLLKQDEVTAEIPVIFLTAHRDEEHILRGFAAGAVDYVTKPFRVDEMLSRVHTHMELKRARDTLRTQNQELAEVNRQKDTFFSILAHDLRNPLSGIMSLSQLLQEQYDELSVDEFREMVGTLSESSQQLHKLLENLLEWAQLQLSTTDAVPERIDVGSLIADCVRLYAGAASEKEVAITTEAEDGLSVVADKHMTASVVRNLLSNALKYSRSGDTISVTASRLPAGTGVTKAGGSEHNVSPQLSPLVEFVVSDTGTGMSPETVEHLFRPDKRISVPGTQGEEGSGLGLMLCKDQVERNGGTLQVTSTLGEGSRFTFTLPATQ